MDDAAREWVILGPGALFLLRDKLTFFTSEFRSKRAMSKARVPIITGGDEHA